MPVDDIMKKSLKISFWEEGMKKLLLIVGIVAIVACVILFLLAVIFGFSYNNLYDGTPEHYEMLHSRMIVSFFSGIVLAVIGTACFIIRTKI
ncbi:MAG: hypothetical protein IKR46_02665 [Clostridia bacterium]|nr:hypothetical protein [Clostridia bacterium]